MKKTDWQNIRHWLRPGIRVKRWVLLCAVGMVLLGAALAQGIALLRETGILDTWTDVLLLTFLPPAWRVLVFFILGACLVAVALYELYHAVIRPLAEQQNRPWLDMLVRYNRLQRGQHVVVIGGGTGLPSVLRGMKAVTNNITAVVTMADDGGSSGRLRRELGVPPPGDLRNNIAALSDDEDMMTRLFQYRFSDGALGGHSFGNLFLTALSDITGNMDAAVAVAGRVLAITGRVLPSTLHNVNLVADIRTPAGRRMRVYGESNIAAAGGTIERVMLEPMSVPALPEVIRAILNADLIVIGPGSLYTSILPNLLVRGVAEALQVSTAQVVYVCNIAQQPGETGGYTVADHVLALEKHVGQGIINVVLANDHYPPLRRGDVTRYVRFDVQPTPVLQRYHVVRADLTDAARPWRHDSEKLVAQLLKLEAALEAAKQSKSLSRPA